MIEQAHPRNLNGWRAEARRLYAEEGLSYRAIAARLGVSKTAVGDALTKPDPKTDIDRFFMKVARQYDGCWHWRGHISQDGYGRHSVAGRQITAHRAAYLLLIGAIPDGYELDHLCETKHCVNPAHLEPVTHRENVLRGDGPTAQNARKTHCINGHDLRNVENLYSFSDSRVCRQCNKINRLGGDHRAA